MTIVDGMKTLITLLILACLALPVTGMYKFEMSQWEVFRDTWFFVIYALVVFIVGMGVIGALWRSDEPKE